MEKVTVKFVGIRPKGTLNPRRMWRPGDREKVEPSVAEELLKKSGFVKIRSRKRKKTEKKSDPVIPEDPVLGLLGDIENPDNPEKEE